MTVIIAMKDDNHNVYIGTDLRASFTTSFVSLPHPKWINFGGKALVASAGRAIHHQYLLKLASDAKQVNKFDFTTPLGVTHFSDFIKAELGEEDLIYEDDESGTKVWAGQFLIATPSKIWVLSSDGFVLERPDFGSIGCGADFAYGAYYAYLKMNKGSVDARQVIKLGIEAAATFDSACGGHSEIVCVKDLKKEATPDAIRNTRQSPQRKR